MDIGSRLKQLRNMRGLTAQQLAQKVGISREHLSGVENNSKSVSLTTLNKICNEFGITLTDFFASDDKTLPLEYQELLENVKTLSPSQLKSLNQFLRTLKEEKR